MKILYVDHGSLVSGAQWALLDLIAGLPDHVEPLLMCPPGPLADLAVERGATHLAFVGTSASLRLHPVHTTRALIDAFRSSVALRRAASRGVDLVHANSIRAGLLAWTGRGRHAPPFVVHIHDAMPDGRTSAMVKRVLQRSSDAAITISEYTTRNYCGDRGREHVHVLFNPLDTERFDPARMSRDDARRRLGLSLEEPIVGLVAQITPWKGQATAIRAMALLRQRHPGARLLIAGETKFVEKATRYDNRTYEQELHTLVYDLGLSGHVDFLGEVSDVPTLVRAFDVSVGPSWEEPFGRSMVESMSLETYTIATSVGGPVEFVTDGVHGRIVDPHDADAWANAIAAALDDPAERRATARRGSEYVRSRFERGRYVDRVVGLYESLLPAGSR